MPDLRLTPERRMQIERRVQRSLLSLADPDEGSPTPEWPDVYAEDAGDLLHDLDVLEREVERLRAVLQKRLVTKWRSGHRVYYQCDECGQRADAPERIEHIACPLSDAAIAERGGEG